MGRQRNSAEAVINMMDPVIILAPPRSFTSVIAAMLGQHPQLFGMPELNLFVAESMQEREGVLAEYRFSNDGLLRAVAQLLAGAQTPQTIMLANGWTLRRRCLPCVSVFRELAAMTRPRRLVDKSPITTWKCEYLQRLHRSIPGTNYIHLLRNPITQGNSVWRNWGVRVALRLQAVDYSSSTPVVDLQKAWFSIHANILSFLNGIPDRQKMRIRGEDLISDPDSHLTRIAGWLGISVEKQAIEHMKHPEASPFACLGPSNAPFGNDPDFLRSPRLRMASECANPPLEGPVPWRVDGKGLSHEVIGLAREFGYT